jgi:hypothetical protein
MLTELSHWGHRLVCLKKNFKNNWSPIRTVNAINTMRIQAKSKSNKKNPKNNKEINVNRLKKQIIILVFISRYLGVLMIKVIVPLLQNKSFERESLSIFNIFLN